MTRSILLILALVMLAPACKTSPAIPDQTDNKTVSYRSTDAGEEAGEATDKTTDKPTTDEPAPTPQDADSSGQLQATGPVALVNSQPITAQEFNDEVAKIMASGQLPPHVLAQITGARRDQLKERIISGIVMRKLIEQEIAANNFTISDDEIDARLQQMQAELELVSQMNPGAFASLEEMRKQMGISTAELRDSVSQAIALERLVQKAHAYSPATEAEAQTFYDENKDRFQQPEQVRARHILRRVEDSTDQKAWDTAEAEIKAIYKDVTANGVAFADAAKEHSDDPSGQRGGDLGFFPRNVMVPEFEKVAFGLSDGEVSKPLKTTFGWHVIKRESYRAAGPIPFATIKDQLIAQITNSRFQQSLEAYIQDLESRATIELKPENIT